MSLKELLGEELYSQVQEKIGDDKVFLASENDNGQYVPKETFNEKVKKAKFLEEQINQRDEQIEQLKKDASTSKELKAKIEELQEKNEQTQTELQEKLRQQKLEAEIDKALLKNKARNPKAVKALLEMDKVEMTEEGIKGLNEQLESIKENDDYLFENEDKSNSKTAGDFNTNQNSDKETEEQWLEKMMNIGKNY